MKRWEVHEGLPVHRHLHRRQSTVFAYRSELDAWRTERSLSAEPALGYGGSTDLPDGILVLPFDHIGPDASHAWLADGFSEALISDLSALRGLRVLSSTSSRSMRGRSHDARSIGRRNGVRYLVEGSCRNLDSRARISVRLIDVSQDASIWSQAFEGRVTDAFELQSRLASAVAEALEQAGECILSAAKPPAAAAEEVATWQCLTLARQQALSWRPEGLAAAVTRLEEGLATIGGHPSLLAALGRTWLQYRESATDLGPSPLDNARDCARRLAACAPNHPGTLQLRGWIAYAEGRIFDAIDALYRSDRARPNDPETLGLLVNSLLISDQADAARPLIEHLLAIDPLNPLTACLPGWDHLLAGDFDAALPYYETMHSMDPAHPMGRLFLVWTSILAGRTEGLEALATPEDDTLASQPALRVARFLIAAARGQRHAERWLDDSVTRMAEASEMIARFLADGYAVLGHHDQAVRWLRRAVDFGFVHLAFLEERNPLLRHLHDNADFGRLLEHVRQRRSNPELRKAAAFGPRQSAKDNRSGRN